MAVPHGDTGFLQAAVCASGLIAAAAAQDRKCQGPGCARMPNFNFPGEKGGIFCAQHKAEGMVDIKHKRCVEPGCSKRPSFNFTGALLWRCSVMLRQSHLLQVPDTLLDILMLPIPVSIHDCWWRGLVPGCKHCACMSLLRRMLQPFLMWHQTWQAGSCLWASGRALHAVLLPA